MILLATPRSTALLISTFFTLASLRAAIFALLNHFGWYARVGNNVFFEDVIGPF